MTKENKKIYCGIDKLKKNQIRGTPTECAEIKQVRYYGINKVTKEEANEYKGIPVESKLREKRLVKTIGSLRGIIDKYNEEIEDYKNEDDYKKNKNYQKAVKDLEEKNQEFKEKLKKVLIKYREFKEQAKIKADKIIKEKTKEQTKKKKRKNN
jgi:hypothetical protein